MARKVPWKDSCPVVLIGFAFVEFDNANDAEDSVKEMDGKKVCGVHIRVELAKESSK